MERMNYMVVRYLNELARDHVRQFALSKIRRPPELKLLVPDEEIVNAYLSLFRTLPREMRSFLRKDMNMERNWWQGKIHRATLYRYRSKVFQKVIGGLSQQKVISYNQGGSK